MDDKEKYIPLPLIPISLLAKFDEYLIESLPKEYKDVIDHYLNAKIEFLKSIEEIIKLNIKRLEEIREKLTVKKEKVDLE